MNKNVSIRLKRVITRNLLLVVIGIIGLLFSGNIGLHMIASAATQSEQEKNDSYATANTIALGNSVTGTISSYDDVDYYKLVPASNGKIELDFCHTYVDSSAYWKVYTYIYENGEYVELSKWSIGLNDGEKESLPYLGVVKNGVYYVKVESDYDSVLGENYTIQTKFTSSNYFERERNDVYAKEEVLRNKIQEKTPDKISAEYYDDYDGDGKKELFAVTGSEDGPNEIWYASNVQVKRIYNDDLVVYKWASQICKVSKKQKLILFEIGGFGSGSISLCYYVKNGKVIEVKKAGEGLTQRSGKEFMVHPSAFDYSSDGTGHTWKAYYLKWNGKKFVEYKGKKIALSKLKKYKGAKKYIRQLKKLGYKIGSIYYRKNGIINVNLSIKSGEMLQYENVTFIVQKKKVKLKVINKKGKNIVEKSSYGGRYRAKGF